MKIVIVTTTFSNDPMHDYRFQLALQMCQTAHVFGYPIIVVDGSPDPTARELLIRAGAVVKEQNAKGMGASRRQCIDAGLNTFAEVVVWIEPEKVGMIPMLKPCVEMVEDGYDIVVPWRNRLFADYPPYQALSEARANQEMAEITGLCLDLMIGPRIMSRRGAGVLQFYGGGSLVNPDVKYGDNWEIIFVPILWALHKGLRVGSCPVDYVHPIIQTALEGRNTEMDRKRDTQREVLVSAMRQEARLLGIKRAV